VSWGSSSPTFGTIGSFDESGAAAETALTVSCDGNVAAETRLCDARVGPGGSFTLSSGAATIPFTIDYYAGNGAPIRLHDCASPEIPLSGEDASATYRLVGVIPAGIGPLSDGVYTDTVIATVRY
jgi:spore coat protein U-like protein